jgi:hypothetical protein
LGVGGQEKEIHLLLVLIVVFPSISRLNIGWNDDTTAAPQPQPDELEPSKMSCATLTISLAARNFDQGRNKSDSLV